MSRIFLFLLVKTSCSLIHKCHRGLLFIAWWLVIRGHEMKGGTFRVNYGLKYALPQKTSSAPPPPPHFKKHCYGPYSHNK